MIHLDNIFEYNGKRVDSEYNNRKTQFEDLEELDRYRDYLEKKLRKRIFFMFTVKD